MDPRLIEILERLRASRFAEVKGARASLSIPVPESFLNELIAAALPPGGPLRDLQVRPQAGNRLAVRARASRLDFLPPMTISVQIEQQPQLPDTPLVVRILSLPGLLSMAGSLLSPSSLPPGIRLDRERVLVDVRQLLEKKGLGEIVPLIERLHVSSEEGRLLVDVDIRVVDTARDNAQQFPPDRTTSRPGACSPAVRSRACRIRCRLRTWSASASPRSAVV